MVVMWQHWVIFDDGGMWSLWLFVAICFHGWSLFVVVIVGSHCHSLCWQSLSVIVCVDSGGKQKRSHKQRLTPIFYVRSSVLGTVNGNRTNNVY